MQRISIELTNRCQKSCWFCYNSSTSKGQTEWSVTEVIDFVSDCSKHSTKAVSFGGGEPLEYEGLFEILTKLQGLLHRSITTNGLLLNDENLQLLEKARPEKVHISIHFPDKQKEVDRVIKQVKQIELLDIKSGVNLLVSIKNLTAAKSAAELLRANGIDNKRIIYLPMKIFDIPTPKDIYEVAGKQPFQSMTCLNQCGKSERFCSIAWDKTVSWCSYTKARTKLESLTVKALKAALEKTEIEFCGVLRS